MRKNPIFWVISLILAVPGNEVAEVKKEDKELLLPIVYKEPLWNLHIPKQNPYQEFLDALSPLRDIPFINNVVVEMTSAFA